MEIEINDLKITCLIPLDVYSLDVIHKCFYWYGSLFSVDIAKCGEHAKVTLEPKRQCQQQIQPERIRERIRTDLVDFQTRDIVTRETKTIRELLVAKAFAPLDGADTP